MEISVRPAESWSEFEDVWNESMKHLYWFTDATPADYQRERDLKELENEFASENHTYLIARDADGNALGTLTYSITSSYARNSIMMPGVPMVSRRLNVELALFAYQERMLRGAGIKTIFSSLKYRTRTEVDWYFDTLTKNGFIESEPEGYQLLVSLDDISSRLKNPGTVAFRTRDAFSTDDFVDFTMRAYATTPEDLAIHGYDRSVTVPEHIRAIHQRVINGDFGKSPPEWWRVATRDETAAGYILGFETEPLRDPRLAIIGNLGVFPEFRRGGIAVSLIHSLFNEFLQSGIEYVMVGTPTHNIPAIGAYKRAGFHEANKIQFFRKDL